MKLGGMLRKAAVLGTPVGDLKVARKIGKMVLGGGGAQAAAAAAAPAKPPMNYMKPTPIAASRPAGGRSYASYREGGMVKGITNSTHQKFHGGCRGR